MVCNPNITCYKYNKNGRIHPFCPVSDDFQEIQVIFTSSEGRQIIPKS